jgi:hypothetical protein
VALKRQSFINEIKPERACCMTINSRLKEINQDHQWSKERGKTLSNEKKKKIKKIVNKIPKQ